MSNELNGFFTYAMMMLDERQRKHAINVDTDGRGWFSKNRNENSVTKYQEVSSIKAEVENLARQFGITVMDDPLSFDITKDFGLNNKARNLKFIQLGEF